LNSATSYGGKDGYGVAVLDGRLEAGQESHVFVVEVHVDEAAQLPVVDQPRLQAIVPGLQVRDQLAKSGSGPLDRLLATVYVRKIVGMRTSMAMNNAPVVVIRCRSWQRYGAADHSGEARISTVSSVTWPSTIR
jgi:hypothetical protein